MSEPRAVAASVETLDEDLGIVYWSVEDDRIGGNASTAYALVGDEGAVLIDPLPLAPEALEGLGEIRAIVLTGESHQRSAWRLRAELEGVPVWAPALSQGLAEEPDDRYGHSGVLPGDLVATHVPGAGPDQHVLVLEDYVGFLPDLVMRPPGGELSLAPDELLESPLQARSSLKLLVELGLEVACPTHGLPLDEGVPEAFEAALERAGEVQDPDYVFVEPEEPEPSDEDEAGEDEEDSEPGEEPEPPSLTPPS